MKNVITRRDFRWEDFRRSKKKSWKEKEMRKIWSIMTFGRDHNWKYEMITLCQRSQCSCNLKKKWTTFTIIFDWTPHKKMVGLVDPIIFLFQKKCHSKSCKKMFIKTKFCNTKANKNLKFKNFIKIFQISFILVVHSKIKKKIGYLSSSWHWRRTGNGLHDFDNIIRFDFVSSKIIRQNARIKNWPPLLSILMYNEIFFQQSRLSYSSYHSVIMRE